jgi:hypothetical protein
VLVFRGDETLLAAVEHYLEHEASAKEEAWADVWDTVPLISHQSI